MESSKIKRTLQNAGLSQYQADAYLTVLQLGTADATEIASQSGVPKSRIYDVLRHLEDNGYVETFEQDSLRARAQDPAPVLTELREQAKSFEMTAGEIEELWESPSVGNHQVTLVKRKETAIESTRDAIREADHEIQLSVTPDQFDQLKPVLHEARNRDVIVKVSLHAPEVKGEIPLAESDFEGAASEVRYRELSAPFVALIDRTQTFFASRSPGNQFGILVDNYTLTYVFHWYFQMSLWEIWETVYTDHNEEAPYQFVNIRECIREIDRILDDGYSVHAKVIGYDTITNERQEISGSIIDISKMEPARDTQKASLSEIAGKATIYLDTGEEVVSIGDWGAIEEDIEGRKIQFEIIED